MKHTAYILLLGGLLGGLVGCNKYLEVQPDNTLTVPKTLTDLQALLNNSQKMNLQRTPNFSEASGDDYFLSDDQFNSLDVELQRIYTWKVKEYKFQNDWSIAYEPVFIANLCLEQLQKIPPTTNQAVWNQVKGAALFFRSYYFQQLVNTFAPAYDAATATNDLGIVLRTHSDFNEPSERASVQQTLEQVLHDAKEAAYLLPDLPKLPTMPSKAAAYGLLARTYLSMRYYDSAYHYADAALHLKSDLMNFAADNDINSSITSQIPFRQFNKETIFYSEMATTNYVINPSTIAVDSNIIKSYNKDDLRLTAFYTKEDTIYRFKGSYTGNEWQYFTGIAVDELYLIRSECAARVGIIGQAISDMQTLLKSRWNESANPPVITPADSKEAVTMILNERRKELFMRGTRWMDIKRLNKEGRNISLQRVVAGTTYRLNANDPYFALPLPQDIVSNTVPQNKY
ncbi:RagB/SusD family nutrient uptake outer membrane protein [Chitinophaga hostae]|uniref:RagB/SusD family nutrient uptake outer membrane protein n=1 Tax=Chitinophaga hostae TaxID=2831022 RepID=A0ABS5IVU8_9BACT|nr:RagB/SusD family nutrient uptake outer membrane protein [Chitinophaga hostae]MBS0027093.1 RagB/SusD family nutrient uptake outer membrane protein [Chitinophaga hostae]